MNRSTAIATKRSTRDFESLTDVSKALNRAFGDRTSRTVSRRIANGFKNTFDLENMEDDKAEDIVHLSMVASGGLLCSKSDGGKTVGVLLLAALFLCYQNDE